MLSRETVKIKNLDFAQFECFRYLYRCDLVVELQKGVERAEKYRYGREKHPKRWYRKERIPIFYQQFEGRYRIIFQGGTWSLECGKYALASRCDLPGGRQPDLGPSGCAESEYYPQMVLEHSESLGVIPP